jgi:hypothetical protein
VSSASLHTLVDAALVKQRQQQQQQQQTTVQPRRDEEGVQSLQSATASTIPNQIRQAVSSVQIMNNLLTDAITSSPPLASNQQQQAGNAAPCDAVLSVSPTATANMSTMPNRNRGQFSSLLALLTEGDSSPLPACSAAYVSEALSSISHASPSPASGNAGSAAPGFLATDRVQSAEAACDVSQSGRGLRGSPTAAIDRPAADSIALTEETLQQQQQQRNQSNLVETIVNPSTGAMDGLEFSDLQLGDFTACSSKRSTD